ncbi:MAG: putative nucleotide-diphospho-sugar transferase [Prosthecobacter sp.]
MSRGFLYTAFGSRYLAEARVSAKSVKKADPGAKICVVTDQTLEPDAEFDIVLPITPPGEVETYAPLDTGAYYRKIPQYARSPFDRTVYLDSDTYVTAPLTDLFDLLERYDMLVTHDGSAEVNYAFEQTHPPFVQIPKAFGAFNTGVIAFRKTPATQQFFQRWQQNYEEHVRPHTTNDQPAFRLSLFQSDLRYHVLPGTYNWFSWVRNIIPSGGRVVVMHGRNHWLFKWAGQFNAETTTLVGFPSLKLLVLTNVARVLHKLANKGIVSRPKL